MERQRKTHGAGGTAELGGRRYVRWEFGGVVASVNWRVVELISLEEGEKGRTWQVSALPNLQVNRT